MRYCPSRCLLLLALLLHACADNNRDQTRTVAGDVTNGTNAVFPHPEGWEAGTLHGIAALAPGPLLDLSRCDACHDPNATNTDNIPGCRACHAIYPHTDGWKEGAQHGEAALDESHQVDIDRCNSCHDPEGGAAPYAPGCFTCHANFPHPTDWNSGENHGLEIFRAPVDQLTACRSCHGAELDGGNAEVSCRSCHSFPDRRQPSQHAPVASQSCDSCHVTDAKDAQAPHFLRATVPTLCWTCHDIARTPPQVTHDPVTTGDACLICHLPHDSSNEHILNQAQPTLCFSCHDRDQGTARNVQSEYDQSSTRHRPFEDGKCSTCHEVHGSDYARLLESNDPMFWITATTPISGISCFGCHSVITYGTGNLYLPYPAPASRPAANLATQFVLLQPGSNRSENLHVLHLLQKGVGCLACHNPHGESNPYLLRSYISYTEPGASFWTFSRCGGCHANKYPPGYPNGLW